jgi:hypothetical protein
MIDFNKGNTARNHPPKLEEISGFDTMLGLKNPEVKSNRWRKAKVTRPIAVKADPMSGSATICKLPAGAMLLIIPFYFENWAAVKLRDNTIGYIK